MELASAKGYKLVETTLFNAIFVPEELFDNFIPCIPVNPTIDVLHEVTMGTDLFQLYDGTLQIAGCKKLLWHRLPIDVNKLQVLKEKDRSFPFAPSPNIKERKGEAYCMP